MSCGARSDATLGMRQDAVCAHSCYVTFGKHDPCVVKQIQYLLITVYSIDLRDAGDSYKVCTFVLTVAVP